jgi:excisionase family DNA binding protein
MGKLTTSQAARALGVHRRTLQRWFRQGLQEPELVQVGAIRHRLYSAEDLQRCRDFQRELQGRRAASTNVQTPGQVE